MATFTWTPTGEPTQIVAPRVTRFGVMDERVEERTFDGLNTDLRSWRLEFKNINDTERDEIRSFLDARGGAESFDWTDPYGRQGKFICETWETSLDYCGLSTITASFEEVPA